MNDQMNQNSSEGANEEINKANIVEETKKEERNENLPTKVSIWSKIKSFFLKDITVELTPKQQAFEDKLNEVLHREITFGKKKNKQTNN